MILAYAWEKAAKYNTNIDSYTSNSQKSHKEIAYCTEQLQQFNHPKGKKNRPLKICLILVQNCSKLVHGSIILDSPHPKAVQMSV
jgi:hypothetical protein